nr:MAG TPA: hypothetical protein [Caudoviricetes sp.]
MQVFSQKQSKIMLIVNFFRYSDVLFLFTFQLFSIVFN